jgi:Trp operon repressor
MVVRTATKRLVAAFAAVVLLLFGVCWSAYRWGEKNERARASALLQTTIGKCEQEDLRIRLEALHILVQHTDRLSKDEIHSFARATGLSITDVTRSVNRLRQAGDEPEADRLQRMIDEVSELLVQLTRERK